MARTPQAVLDVADYLILSALAKRPMAVREIAHTIRISQATVGKKLKVYADLGLVVKGANHQWHASMVLWVAPAGEVVEGVTGRKSDTKVLPGSDVTFEIPSEAPQIDRSDVPPPLPDFTPPPLPPEPYRPPATRTKVSDKAARMAARFNIPGHLEGRGEVSLGRVAQCILCSTRTTPFKYGIGTEAVCPKCARGGK